MVTALAAASAAAGVGVRIFSAGVGSEAGATIPVLNRATRAIVPKIDAASGRPVTTRLDSQALITLARRGDGRFLRLDRPGALSNLAGDLNALEASRFQVSTTRRPIERFQIPLAVALALLLMEPLIAARAPATNAAGTPERRPRQRPRLRRRWLFAGLLPIVAIVAAACGNLAADRNTSGNRAYAEGRFADAATAYSEALAERPDDPRLALNLGRALHALGQYDAAVSATQRALAQSAADSALRRARLLQSRQSPRPAGRSDRRPQRLDVGAAARPGRRRRQDQSRDRQRRQHAGAGPQSGPRLALKLALKLDRCLRRCG